MKLGDTKSDEHEEDTIKEDFGFEEEIDKTVLNCFVCSICIYTAHVNSANAALQLRSNQFCDYFHGRSPVIF